MPVGAGLSRSKLVDAKGGRLTSLPFNFEQNKHEAAREREAGEFAG